MIYSFYETKNINYFNAKESTWPFERLEHYLERQIQGMLKSFTVRRNKKILDAILQYWVILACLGYFWFILPRSCLFQLVAVGYRLFHISLKKWRLIRHVKNWKHLKVKVRKAHKNWGPIRHVKKEGMWEVKTRRHTGM